MNTNKKKEEKNDHSHQVCSQDHLCLCHSFPCSSGSFSFFLPSFLEQEGEFLGWVEHTADCLVVLAFRLMSTITTLGSRS